MKAASIFRSVLALTAFSISFHLAGACALGQDVGADVGGGAGIFRSQACVLPLPGGEGRGEGEGGLQLSGTRRFAWHGALFSFAHKPAVIRQRMLGALLQCPPNCVTDEFIRSSQAHWCFERCLPLTPALSLGERANLPPPLRQSRAPALIAARDAEFPLPQGEGQGEGEPDAANQNARTYSASSISALHCGAHGALGATSDLRKPHDGCSLSPWKGERGCRTELSQILPTRQ